MKDLQSVKELRDRLESAGQGHVFRFWKELTDDQRQTLLDDLALVNLDALGSALSGRPGPSAAAGKPEAPEVTRRAELDSSVPARGREVLAAGKVAAFTVAGGQGTRLGFDGPKGILPISPVKGKTLFRLFAEYIAGAQRCYGGRIPWYIMTSASNDAATRSYFETNDYFGLRPGDVTFFEQGVMPAVDQAGRILLAEPGRLALSPDGHGGSLRAMAASGALADMAARGVEHISYFQVDNPLVACIDPAFIGLHAMRQSEMSSKVVPKADDFEKVGNFVVRDGRMTVIEYSNLPRDLALARNKDGGRLFDAANIAVHLLSLGFVERLTADQAFALTWHRAHKAVPCVDVASGHPIQPVEPNAYKLETFVFDALPLARHTVLLETRRDEEFSPVKNRTGIDSIDTARADMSRRAARWLEAAGWVVPRDGRGEADGVFEISPLLALDAQHLCEARLPLRRFAAGEQVYLE